MDSNLFTSVCHPRPYVELMNFLLKCGGEVEAWVGRQLRGQCQQHWGALCGSFANICPDNQSAVLNDTTAPSAAQPVTSAEPTRGAELENKSPATSMNGTTEPSLSVSEHPFISDS